MDVTYDQNRFRVLSELRSEARALLQALSKCSQKPVVYGSTARGDVDEESDVDIFIPTVVPSYQIQLALSRSGFTIGARHIVMATPWHLPKIHLDIGNERIVTAPLIKPRRIEREFYQFGGSLTLDELGDERRVPGVNKELKLIKPTPDGHIEEAVEGQEGVVAKQLGISTQMVRERIAVLNRRERVGRTGVHIKRKLAPMENVETVLKQLVDDNPKIRQRFRT